MFKNNIVDDQFNMAQEQQSLTVLNQEDFAIFFQNLGHL